MNIVLIGPPGAGKGTQAVRLQRSRGMVHIATGEILREALRSGSPAGLQAKAALASGELVSDGVVLALLDERLDQVGRDQSLILDGYPRTIPQIAELDALFARRNLELDLVIELVIDEDALVERITGRLSCGKCGEGYHDRHKRPSRYGFCDVCMSKDFVRRADDNELTARTRLAEYREKTAPILAVYRARELVREIDASVAIEQVNLAVDLLFSE